MLLRRFTDFILRSRVSAMSVAFLLSFVPLIGASVSILVAALVTLRKGAVEGSLVLGASIAPYLLAYVVAPQTDDQFIFIATGAIIAINVLTWLLSVVLRRFANWSWVVEIATYVGIVLVCVIHLIYPDLSAWWSTQLTAYFNKTAVMVGQLVPDGASSTEAVSAEMIANVKRFVTGFLVASIVFNALLQLVLARWWQSVIFNPGALQRELHQVRLSYISVAMFVLVSILAYLENALGLDLLPVLITAFGMSGMSLIHRLVLSNRAAWFWLTLIYISILLMFPLGLMLVAMVGVFDSLLDLRKKFDLK